MVVKVDVKSDWSNILQSASKREAQCFCLSNDSWQYWLVGSMTWQDAVALA